MIKKFFLIFLIIFLLFCVKIILDNYTKLNKKLSGFEKLNSSSVKIDYSFDNSTNIGYLTFAEGSICMYTTPWTDASGTYDNRFTVELIKDGPLWFNPSKGIKTFSVNEGGQSARWDNIESGKYKLYFKKVKNDSNGVYFNDFSAKIENCDFK